MNSKANTKTTGLSDHEDDEEVQKEDEIQSPKKKIAKVDPAIEIIAEPTSSLSSAGGNDTASFTTATNRTIIPSQITTISKGPFEGCFSLESATLPYSSPPSIITIPPPITLIAEDTFSKSTSLKSIHLHPDIQNIGYGAFMKCTSLSTIDIPPSVKLINYNTFVNCQSLQSVSLPDTIRYIGVCAFQDCRSLPSIHLPSSLRHIGWKAFMQCTSLEEISIPLHITSIHEETFCECYSLTNVDLPITIASIERGAFRNCPRLKSIFVPYQTQIHDQAFDHGVRIIRKENWKRLGGYVTLRELVSLGRAIPKGDLQNVIRNDDDAQEMSILQYLVTNVCDDIFRATLEFAIEKPVEDEFTGGNGRLTDF